MISEVFHDLLFSLNQTLKSADLGWKILKNKSLKLKKEDFTLLLVHGTYSYICMYVNAVANSVILQLHLRLGCYNLIFKVKHKF
jgi:hypothetical protein